MALGGRLRKAFGGRSSSREQVPFLDAGAERVVHILASELRPSPIQVRLQPSGRVVRADPNTLRQSEVRHPAFSGVVRGHIRRIQAAFGERRPLSFEEWEEGVRRDAGPEPAIAIRLRAADTYEVSAGGASDAGRRKDVYRRIVACMTAGPDVVWRAPRPQVLSRAEAEQVAGRFFYGRAEPGRPPGGGR